MLYRPEWGAGLAPPIPLGFHHPQARQLPAAASSPLPCHVCRLLLETHCLGCSGFLVLPGMIHRRRCGPAGYAFPSGPGSRALGSLHAGLSLVAGAGPLHHKPGDLLVPHSPRETQARLPEEAHNARWHPPRGAPSSAGHIAPRSALSIAFCRKRQGSLRPPSPRPWI